MTNEVATVKSKKPKTEANVDLAAENWRQYVRARDSGHLEYCERADKCDRFYRGDQWDDFDKRKLEAQGRPAITINTILPTINTVLGEQAAKRAKAAFRPRRNGDPQVATALTKLVMQIMSNNKFDYRESEVFADGLIIERGYFDVRMSFDDHMLGDVSIGTLDPRDVLLDPDGQDYDPKSWRQVTVTRWKSIDEIEQDFGREKADSLRGVAASADDYGYDSMRFVKENRFGTSESWSDDSGSDDDDSRSIRKIRVIERQYYRYVPTVHFVTQTGDLRPVPETWTEEKAKQFAQINDLGLFKKMARKVRWTVTADKVLLHDSWSPYASFTVIPYFCYFRRGKPFGMVTNLISPQEQVNKIASQELHIVNTTANSGWVFESGSLVGMTGDDLVERGAETGLVLEVAPGRNPPAKIQANNIPTGLDRIGLKSQNNIREISGVSEAMMGVDTPEVSGVALENKERRGQIQIQKPLDNLARTRQMVYEKVLELVQQFYTEERTIQITHEWQPGEPQEELNINQPTAEGTILNDLTLGEYDVIVSTIPAHETYDDLMFAEVLQLRNVGVGIPDHHVVKHSHLPNRDELAEEIAQINGFGKPTPEEMEMAQIQQQLALAMQQAELGKLQGEVAELESIVQLNQAKAQDLDARGQLAAAQLAIDLEKKKTELQLRERLAQLSSQTQLQKQQMGGETRLIGDAMNRSAQLFQNRNQPKKAEKQ